MDDAAVLQQCAANPDDDAPRLVWADLVGGERGELVVVQCDLARGGLTPAEAAKRRARERELLQKHGVAWAGELASVATRWAFRRGFIEAAHFPALDFDHSKLPPLLATASIRAGETAAEEIEKLGRARRLRGLALQGSVRDRGMFKFLAESEHFTELRALAVDYMHEFPELRPLIAARPIEQLRLHLHRMSTTDVKSLAAAAPKLASLDIAPDRDASDDVFLAEYMHRPLRALRTTNLGWKHIMYMAEHSGPTLEHLAFPLEHEAKRTLGELAKYKVLRTLELGGKQHELHAAVEAFTRIQGFEQLRVLRIREQLYPDELTTLRGRFANQLEVLEAPIVDDKRILHDEPSTPFTLAPTCYVQTPSVCIAQRNAGGKIWELPARPADEHIFIGRGAERNDIVLFSAFVARRHCALIWTRDHHELHDLGSDNGTWIDGKMIRRTQIEDGTDFLVGNVPLVYFVGEGAKQRAEAAARA